MRIVPVPLLGKWTRTSSETIGKYRVFDVARQTFADASGRDRGHAFTIQCTDWCNVVALTPEDEVVLVWQYRFGTDALSLEIPGGMIEKGESPEVAAARELLEETGYEAESVELLVVVEPNPALQGNRCFTYVARGARRTSATSFDAMEELETVLLPASRVGELLDSGQVTHALVQGPLEAFWRKRPR